MATDNPVADVTVDVVQFRIPGNPVPKGRARAFLRGNHIAHYTPDKTRAWESVARMAASEAMQERTPMQGPVVLWVAATFAPPASWPKWRQQLLAEDGLAHTTKPDLDNLVKAVKDACNGIVWKDDSQVIQIRASKLYGETPAMHVQVVSDHRLGAQQTREKIRAESK
jgi:Holliday junction resolvase RusA-like endonuclease